MLQNKNKRQTFIKHLDLLLFKRRNDFSLSLYLPVPGKGVALLEVDTGNGQVSHPLLRLVVGLVLPLLFQHLRHQDGHQVFLNISKVLSDVMAQ